MGKENKKLWGERLNALVIKYFKDYLPAFRVKKEFSYGPFWGVTMIGEGVEIKIEGDVGFNIKILIDNKDFPLWTFDRKVGDAQQTTDENILYQLSILTKFLNP